MTACKEKLIILEYYAGMTVSVPVLVVDSQFKETSIRMDQVDQIIISNLLLLNDQLVTK
jgi:hypothetical protein